MSSLPPSITRRLMRVHASLNQHQDKNQKVHRQKKIVPQAFISMIQSKIRPQKLEENLPEPVGELRKLFEPVKELFLSGGGGAGRSLPSAMEEAENFGLKLSNIKAITATSVGSILALAMTLEISINRLNSLLDEMPTHLFQDWNLKTLFQFSKNWGLCAGDAMPNYFRKLIKQETGLEDPTFLELYQAGYQKELRIVTGNVSDCSIGLFSYKETPNMKVADIVGLACRVPLVFPPLWIPNAKGKLKAHTDGGVIKNNPFGMGSPPGISLEEMLGVVFVNESAAFALSKNSKVTFISTLFQYIKNILTMLVFQDLLCLPEAIKLRTVTIKVKYNPLKFTATYSEQERLNKAGKMGVRILVQRILKMKEKEKRKKIEEEKEKKKNEEQKKAPLLMKFNQKKAEEVTQVLLPTSVRRFTM